MDVRVRKTSDENLHAANIYFRNRGEGYEQLKAFLELFGKTIDDKESSRTLLNIKLGKSTCVRFRGNLLMLSAFEVC